MDINKLCVILKKIVIMIAPSRHCPQEWTKEMFALINDLQAGSGIQKISEINKDFKK